MYNDNNLFFKIAFTIIGIWLLTLSVVGEGWNNAYSQISETNVIPNTEYVFKSESMTLPSSLQAAEEKTL